MGGRGAANLICDAGHGKGGRGAAPRRGEGNGGSGLRRGPRGGRVLPPSSSSSAGGGARSERAPPAPEKGKWSGDEVGVTAAEVPGSLPRRSRLSSLVPGGSAPRCRCSGLGEELPP